MENPGSELKKESKADIWKSLWWPRITGIVLAVITLSLTGFVPFLPYGMLGENIMYVFEYGIWAAMIFVVIAAFFWKGMNSVITVRWWAKIVGIVASSMMLLVIVGDMVGGHGPPFATFGDVLGFLPWVLEIAGIIIALARYEFIGGVLLTIGGLADQLNVFHGGLNPFILIFFFVGLGLIYCSWRNRRLLAQKFA